MQDMRRENGGEGKKLGGWKTEERRTAADDIGNGRDPGGTGEWTSGSCSLGLRFGRETAVKEGLCGLSVGLVWCPIKCVVCSV